MRAEPAAPIRRPWRTRAVAVSLAAGLWGAGAAPGVAQDPAILPLQGHAPGEARALAEAHAQELQLLRGDLSRCLPEVDVHRHGIAFRRPRGGAAGPPSLTLWVWLPGADLPAGSDLRRRARHAFHRYGQALFRQLVSRSPVFADPRVGGYGLILTWLGSPRREGRVVGESVAVFADKVATANFVHDTITADVFLSRAEVRLFDGETEVEPPSLSPDDSVSPIAAPC